MSQNTRDCITAVSTIFVFDSPQYQRGCNTVYINISTTDGLSHQNAIGNTNFIKFKTDLDRMKYLLGKYNQKPSCK